MPLSDDKKHFDTYREQTQVKHEILEAYLRPYFHILKAHSDNLIYIDAFAGRGTYTKSETGETAEGSPIRALSLIADSDDFAKQVSTVFIEADPDLFAILESTVEEFYREHSHIRRPQCFHGTFKDQVTQILDLVQGALAPTFLFVDPCGVRGTSFDTIKAVMDYDKCEVFIFFNVDGIRRTAGLPALSPVLVELMGSEERATSLYEALKVTTDTREREEIINQHYRSALVEEIGTEYIATFRIEHEDQRKTSHSLIHATKHPLGFSIMKDVMWKRGRSEDKQGGLEFSQRSRTNVIALFDLPGDEVKQNILSALRERPLRASVFYRQWVQRPDDFQSISSYRQCLLELEAAGEIEVLSEDSQQLMPKARRRHIKGVPTLGEQYLIRIRK